MPPKSPPAFWRRTPPAVFPPIMGLFGLGLAWRRASGAFDVPASWGDLILGAVALLYVFLAGAYLAKVVARPAVVVEDMRVLPGRAGLAALTLSGLLLSAGLVPVFPSAAWTLLILFIVLHLALAVIMLRVLWVAPSEQCQITPAWHLAFVGFIVAPQAAVPMGLTGLTQFILFGTIAIATVIYVVSIKQLARRDPPPPLRPLLAIHLAPLALFGTASHLLGCGTVALLFAGLATIVLVGLLIKARYLTASGFSPLWGAFTFPVAAYAGLMLALGGSGAGEVFRVTGGIMLIAATLLIPAIAWKVLRLWAKGTLAVKTNAAVA